MPLSRSPEPPESRVPPDVRIYTVAELNREARLALEDSLPALWVSGELSNLARPGSGHIYFSLKDEHAQVRCAMFRGANRSLKFSPEDGQQVLVQAKVTVYEPRGSYQLIVDHMEPAGEGLLRQKLEALKTRLATEGLFDPAHKQALPEPPERIGIITSPTGAAVRDILQILERRFATVPVVIYPVQVQGDRAKHDIVAALTAAGERRDCDVLILARGGGSLEDLWSFNEEIVARAIFACPIPVVSAVGHEIDFTIADLVADLRAPTPSGAAELVVPDAITWLANFQSFEKRAAAALERMARRHRELLRQLFGRLERRQPGFVLRQYSQRLDELAQRMTTLLGNRMAMDGLRLGHLLGQLRAAAPLHIVERQKHGLAESDLRLTASIQRRVTAIQQNLSVLAAKLHAVSPLKTLERGFTIVQDYETGAVIRKTGQLKIDQRITGRLADGGFEAVVRKKTKN